MYWCKSCNKKLSGNNKNRLYCSDWCGYAFRRYGHLTLHPEHSLVVKEIHRRARLIESDFEAWKKEFIKVILKRCQRSGEYQYSIF